MKKKKLVLFLSIAVCIQVQAQVPEATGVGIGGEPHEKALLDTYSDGDANGVLFPMVNSEKDLPLYNKDYTGEGDLKYKADPTMAGMIMYVKDQKAYLQYDGASWARVGNMPFYMNPNVTRLGTSSVKGYGNVAGVNMGTGDVDFNRGLDNNSGDYTDGFFNRLGIKRKESSVSGTLWLPYTVHCYEISEDGIYNIGYNLRINGGGADIFSNFKTSVYFQGQFGVSDTNIDKYWVTLDEMIVQPIIILGVGVGIMDCTRSVTAYFKAGDRFRLYWVPSTSIFSASGWGNSIAPELTNLMMEKIQTN